MNKMNYSDAVSIPRRYYGSANVKSADGKTGILFKCDNISDKERAALKAHPACEVVEVRAQYAPELKSSGFIVWRKPHHAYPPFEYAAPQFEYAAM